jgi:hypothetical protein
MTHLANTTVTVGSQVTRTTNIANPSCYIESGGSASGKHVHFGLYHNGSNGGIYETLICGYSVTTEPRISRDGVTVNLNSTASNTNCPPPPPIDTDGDGIVDSADYCDNDPEDLNGVEDVDGCSENSCTTPAHPLMGDVNGDGRDDAIVFTMATGSWQVALSTGSGFAGFSTWAFNHGVNSCQRLIGDVNGDGRADALVFFANGEWHVGLSTGTSFGAPGSGLWASNHGVNSTRRLLADVDGDTRQDAVVYFASGGAWHSGLSSGVSFNKPGSGLWASGHGAGSSNQLLGDVNGDGAADAIVVFRGNGQWYVGTSSGSVFAGSGSGLWAQNHGTNSENQMLGDVSGDGSSDGLVYFDATGEWHAGLSSGINFAGSGGGLWASNHGVGLSYQLVGDATGDGAADAVVYFRGDGCWWIGSSTGSAFIAIGNANWTCGMPGTNGDLDGDTLSDASDNCVSILNATQLNTDVNFIDQTPPSTQDDSTHPNSDTAGDACDTDDDNDGLTDADEASGAACIGIITDPLLRDADGDRVLDGAECVRGTNPTSAASKPTIAQCGPNIDTDGDRLKDYVEVCAYNTDPAVTDTDGDQTLDGARDGCEAASINNDRVINSGDQLLMVLEILREPTPSLRLVSMDVNKDGALNSGDQLLLAQFISPSGQCP